MGNPKDPRRAFVPNVWHLQKEFEIFNCITDNTKVITESRRLSMKNITPGLKNASLIP